jgi:stage II sporulation protein D
VTLESVGPFVSNGDTLSAFLELVAAPEDAVRIDGVPLVGTARVLADEKSLVAVDEVDVEDYVSSVVGGEMPASWPEAALEAQAIAARTYVLRRKLAAKPGAVFHVERTVASQVYKGALGIDRRTRAASDATRGQVLRWDGQLADAFFFATCKGRTESAEAAFGKASPYLVPASCEGGESAPLASWTRTLTLVELSRRLAAAGAIGDGLERVEVASRTATGRAATLRLVTKRGKRTIAAPEFRRLVGWSELPSLDFDGTREGARIVFRGAGSGHGVGLCQWCAKGLATKGWTAAQILARYYPGTSLDNIYQ